MNKPFEEMNYEELQAFIGSIIEGLQRKQKRETKYLNSKRRTPTAQTRPYRELLKEQDVLRATIKLLEHLQVELHAAEQEQKEGQKV